MYHTTVHQRLETESNLLSIFLIHKMPSRDEWLLSQVAPTNDALAAGDGCHHDEAKALGDYLSGNLTTHDAARRITNPLSLESDPPAELGRLWALLCQALVELSHEDRQKTLALLAAVQALPSRSPIDWSQLPGFSHMWSDLHRLHLHGSDPWEKESLTDARRLDLRQHFETVGTIEAEMFVLGERFVPREWGYEVLNLVTSRRAGVDILLNEVYGWLKVAGTKLKQSVDANETNGYSRASAGTRASKWQAGSGTMTEQWAVWKTSLLELGGDDSPLSAEGRRLAAECLELMR